jgi:hypothetical protein
VIAVCRVVLAHVTPHQDEPTRIFGGCSVNPDFTKWLGMVWEALPEEDLAKRKDMLQDANAVLEQLRPQATPASEDPPKNSKPQAFIELSRATEEKAAHPGGPDEWC